MNVLDGFSFNGRIVSVEGFGKGGHDYPFAKPHVFAGCE